MLPLLAVRGTAGLGAFILASFFCCLMAHRESETQLPVCAHRPDPAESWMCIKVLWEELNCQSPESSVTSAERAFLYVCQRRAGTSPCVAGLLPVSVCSRGVCGEDVKSSATSPGKLLLRELSLTDRCGSVLPHRLMQELQRSHRLHL